MFKSVSYVLGIAAMSALLTAAQASAADIHIGADGISINTDSGPTVVAKGPAVSEMRDIDAFTRIKSNAPLDMIFTVQPHRSLQVLAPANVLPLISTTVEGGVLVVRLKGSVHGNADIHLVATGPSLNALDVSGSGDFHVFGLNGGSFTVRLSGSGDVSGVGSVDHVDVHVSGSGDIDFANLKSRSGAIRVAGSGDVKAMVLDSIDVSVAGSGDVTIFGRPAQQLVHTAGSGDIVFR